MTDDAEASTPQVTLSQRLAELAALTALSNPMADKIAAMDLPSTGITSVQAAMLRNNVLPTDMLSKLIGNDTLGTDVMKASGLADALSKARKQAGVTGSVSKFAKQAGVTDSLSKLAGNAGVTDSLSKFMENSGLNDSVSKAVEQSGLLDSLNKLTDRAELFESLGPRMELLSMPKYPQPLAVMPRNRNDEIIARLDAIERRLKAIEDLSYRHGSGNSLN